MHDLRIVFILYKEKKLNHIYHLKELCPDIKLKIESAMFMYPISKLSGPYTHSLVRASF